jgi:NAD(P)-dependent dehydrogenase (short-subunit alcohol dehydrogenase family)
MATYDDLRDQRIVITGGANGIGEAMVRAFSAQGARVFFCDIDERAGKALVKEIDHQAEFARVDLRREGEVIGWVNNIAKNGGTVRALINNAARDPRIALNKVSVRDWDDLFATNLRAYFLMAREIAPHMRVGGSIINFSSITFHISPPELTTYIATKGGALAFTRALARELGPRGIRVNTLSPGWIMTERQKRELVTPAIKRLIRKSQCIPERLQPEDIADVALFLASGASRAITGQEILADRGWAHS